MCDHDPLTNLATVKTDKEVKQTIGDLDMPIDDVPYLKGMLQAARLIQKGINPYQMEMEIRRRLLK